MGMTTIVVLKMHRASMRLPDFLRKIKEARAAIPEAFRDSALVFLGDDGDYDQPSIELSIQYERPETDEGIRDREAYKARSIQKELERDRHLYESLKRRFEGT